MIDLNKFTYNYFLILFSLIPVSIILGSSVSLINILIIDISFLFLIFKSNQLKFLKAEPIKYLIVLYIYLFFNSLVSVDASSGIYRNLGFLRIIILFVAFNFFFNQKFFLEKLLKIWLIIMSIVVFDVFFEYFVGKNLLGYPESREVGVSFGSRLVSFFKDEPIVGGFINGFYLILIGFLANKYYFKQKKIIFFVSIIFLLAILFTGERSNSIKALLGIFLLIIFFKHLEKRFKIIFFTVSLLTLILLIFNSDYLKLRYTEQIKGALTSESRYLALYKSGFEVFKQFPLFGSGNKNYRVVTCDNDNPKIVKSENFLCTTHPHQIYFEFLSEHGLLGTFILLFLFYKIIFSKIFMVIKEANYIQMGSMIFLITTFLPMLPSGSFFNDYGITIFAINLGIMYGSNLNFNVFNKN
tara:strand:+ start:447 stop:1682 length:1236 start_codon:yes stop_codon:yes gene_type:complete